MQKLIDLSQKQNELTALVEKQKLELAKQQKLLDETTTKGVNKMKDIIRTFLKMQDSIELMFEEHFQGNFQINFRGTKEFVKWRWFSVLFLNCDCLTDVSIHTTHHVEDVSPGFDIRVITDIYGFMQTQHAKTNRN